MSITSDYASTPSAPPGTNNLQPGLLSRIGSGIGGYFSNIGKDVSSAVNEGAQSESAAASGQENPLVAGANIAKNVSSAVLSPISELPGLKQLGQGFSNAGQAIVNTSAGNALTDSLAKHVSPTALGTASDLFQTGLNTAGIEGAVGAPEAVSNVWEKAYGGAKDPLSSRISDATPNYKQVLKNEDITGNITNAQGENVPRVNEGTGFRKSTITPSASETSSGNTLNTLSDYPDRGTALQKAQAVNRGISTEAEGMRAGLQAEDKATPLDAATEKAKVQNLVKSNLPENIHSQLGVLTPEEESMVQGMQEKSGAPMPKNGKIDVSSPSDRVVFPRTATGRFFQKVLDATKEYDGTREGKLNLRQAIDAAYKQEGGKYASGSEAQNALYESHADIRNALNQDLAESTKNTDTKASLKKQTDLFRAKDVLRGKAVDEARTQIGRFFQNHPVLHRLVTRDSLRLLSTATGAGIATSFITKLLQGKE